MPTPTSADFAAEFNRLLVTQGHVTRSMHHGWKPSDEQQAEINDRATRLLELAQLLGQDNPGKFVNDRIAAWMKMNPEALTSEQVRDLIESFRQPNADTGVTTGVFIQIGDPGNGGYHYRVMRDDLTYNGQVVFQVPDSVAEHFRQQGRRALQAELRACLNVSRA
jgi:hypothetical protein